MAKRKLTPKRANIKRAIASKNRKIKQGWVPKTYLLPPETLAALDRIRAVVPIETTEREIIEQALKLYAKRVSPV